ncbi:hypothetical protein L6452_41579 [Arctium lappa]|uniref:Uncharacterized protein n=1 Tax=Arctium lappa TaxID=4217 RepID=A0ACB8XP66_ARCLA|nr:hypothetical protein L6452_41579 [Arctium lappa]
MSVYVCILSLEHNLLLSTNDDNSTLKITDFGFARSLQPRGLAETLCGLPLYMAPEIMQLHKYDAKALLAVTMQRENTIHKKQSNSSLSILYHYQVDEYMGFVENVVGFYSKVVHLLRFLLVEAPSLILNPPFSITNSDRYRLGTYIDLIDNRHSHSRSQRGGGAFQHFPA